ncbi:MAG TPA: LL-diaminopimelate aminotransferase [Spirochaetota bacterium]|jgi:LL-diaminopimelate aminotransferase|nr:MAG: LL-diaminopimelate aminotransferase [Spirochaetes bacterium ADurb.Bin133]HNZ25614.1 LL-diaminopimelate aminotransferase [Spirochaetota bacterium]HPY88007.1 LL-diaminopimelate aminotransferase [Spirochaetota bacterium]
MIKINSNYLKLQGSYLFSEIARLVKEYQEKNRDKKIIRLGIGDVTEPLPQSIVGAIKKAANEMGVRESFKGYRSDEGYEFLREKIKNHDFSSRGINIDIDEIFISTGAKEDVANIQEILSADSKIAITDPVYPVYIDSNVMAGRTGDFKNGRFENVCYLDCLESNNYIPDLPKEKVDLIYLCFPNNPTGQVATKEILKKWVNYAKENKSLIIYDAAYEAFITDPSIPKSIFEIEGAKEVAIEFRSLSKTAGFTGVRLSYAIVPKESRAFDENGVAHSLNKLWNRRQSTKFNGVAYIIQRAGEVVFTKEGREEVDKIIKYYLGNAKIIGEGIKKLGIRYSGGVNAPYVWLKTPNNLSSWDFFNKLLSECQVVGTPGVGFGKCGEGYFRLSSFGKREDVEEAIDRIQKLSL